MRRHGNIARGGRNAGRVHRQHAIRVPLEVRQARIGERRHAGGGRADLHEIDAVARSLDSVILHIRAEVVLDQTEIHGIDDAVAVGVAQARAAEIIPDVDVIGQGHGGVAVGVARDAQARTHASATLLLVTEEATKSTGAGKAFSTSGASTAPVRLTLLKIAVVSRMLFFALATCPMETVVPIRTVRGDPTCVQTTPSVDF